VAWECGVGQHNSQGFGMIEACKAWILCWYYSTARRWALQCNWKTQQIKLFSLTIPYKKQGITAFEVDDFETFLDNPTCNEKYLRIKIFCFILLLFMC